MPKKKHRRPATDLPVTWPDPATEPTINIERASELLGIGRTLGFELAKRGEFPVPIIRLGHKIRVPTLPVIRLLSGREDPPHSSGGDDERPRRGPLRPWP